MRIVNLIENTEGVEGCLAQHGLAFYIETKKHRILMDAGPSDAILSNAEKLGINLTDVDIVILSHGHYDHSGGIIPFTGINTGAKIYMQRTALADYYAYDGPQKGYHYIGIDKEIGKLSQVILVDGDLKIDEELSLFSGIGKRYRIPETNARLKEQKEGGYVQDEFAHEQCLVVREGGRTVLFSGCAHNGILNILEHYQNLYGKAPDMVISGFHMMKKEQYTDRELEDMIKTAKLLSKYPTGFYTCHCTGLPAYEVMKKYMGDKLEYVHTGEEIKTVPGNQKKKKGGNKAMKWHKFFAWATVVCFILTMVTGYERK